MDETKAAVQILILRCCLQGIDPTLNPSADTGQEETFAALNSTPESGHSMRREA